MTLRDDIRTLQRKLGITPDGVPGPITIAHAIAAVDELTALKARTAAPGARSGPPEALSPAGGPFPAKTDGKSDLLTSRIALELVDHEAIVQEAYKDSVGVWTWGIGVTSRSGHSVERYKDNPQPIRRCIEIYLWLLQTRYLPDVLAEFASVKLTEAQLAAALSFHYNTGAIRRASWVDLWLASRVDAAKTAIMEWDRPASIIERRQKERDLFFDGKWSQDGMATVFPVRKPSYTPHWGGAKKVDIRPDIEALLGAVQ